MKQKCAICAKSSGRLFAFPHTINDLRKLCEALHISIPSTTLAHPDCVNKLTRKIERLRKRRSV